MAAYPAKVLLPKTVAAPQVVWKFAVGNRVVPIATADTFPRIERKIIQRMVDADTGQTYYRVVFGQSGTALDSAFLMEKNFELVSNQPVR